MARIWELEIHWLLHLWLGNQSAPHHFIQYLLLTLSLLGIFRRTMTEASNIFLHALNLVLFPVVLFHLVLLKLRFGFDKLIVVSIIIYKLALIGEVDGVGGYII